MTDPELQAAMKVLSVLFAAAQFIDFRLSCLQSCRMVTLSIQHGTSGDSAFAYRPLGLPARYTFFTVTVKVIVSASLHATWSRSTHFIANRASVYWPSEWSPPGLSRSGPRLS